MSEDSNKKSGIVMRDRRGVLYAIPAGVAMKYVVPGEEFAAAAAFYKDGESDVVGQTLGGETFNPYDDGLPDDVLINRQVLDLKF